jgi:hypothetical protein
MKSHHVALLFGSPQGEKEPPHSPADSPAEESGETPEDQSAEEGGMSDVEAQHHAKVQHHLGMAIGSHAKGQHRAAKVHVKLAMHHHASAMKEAGVNFGERENVHGDPGANAEESKTSGGAAHTAPGQVSQANEMGDE